MVEGVNRITVGEDGGLLPDNTVLEQLAPKLRAAVDWSVAMRKRDGTVLFMAGSIDPHEPKDFAQMVVSLMREATALAEDKARELFTD